MDFCSEKVAYHNGRRLEQPLETRSYKVKAMAYATANAKELQQTPEQRHLVKAMSDAPPDIRNIMLRNLISQRFGGEQAKSIHLIASLPREQQNMVVQHLLSRMTPQQRHTLTQMKPPQQAELLQRFYERFVLPNLISSNPQKLSSGVGSRPFLNTEQAAMTGQGRSTTTVLNNGNLLAWQRSNDGPNLEPMGRPQPGIPSCYSLQSQTYCPMGPAMYSGVPGHSMIAKDDGPKSYPMQFPSTCQLHNGVHNSMEQNQGAPSLAQQSNSHDDLHVVSSTNKTDFGGLKVSELLGYAGFDDMDALQDAVNYFQNEGI